MNLNHCSLKSELIITNNKKTVLFFRFTDSKTNKVAYMDLLKYLNYTIDPTLGSQGVSKVILLKNDRISSLKTNRVCCLLFYILFELNCIHFFFMYIK